MWIDVEKPDDLLQLAFLIRSFEVGRFASAFSEACTLPALATPPARASCVVTHVQGIAAADEMDDRLDRAHTCVRYARATRVPTVAAHLATSALQLVDQVSLTPGTVAGYYGTTTKLAAQRIVDHLTPTTTPAAAPLAVPPEFKELTEPMYSPTEPDEYFRWFYTTATEWW